MDDLDRYLDETPVPTMVGSLPLDAGSVTWLQSHADLENVSFEQAVAWAVREWLDYCLYPQIVERSLKLGEIADRECADTSSKPKKPTSRRARS